MASKKQIKEAKFALFYTHSPPSRQVLRSDEFVFNKDMPSIAEGQEREWSTKKGNVLGKIIRIGTRTALRALKVNGQGQIKANPTEGETFVLTLREELLQQKQAKDKSIQEMDMVLYEGGFEALEIPIPKPKVDRRPKKRTAEHLQTLQEKFDRLPCLIFKEGDKQISSKNVFVNSTELFFIKSCHNKNPSKMFTTLIEACIPDDILEEDGISFMGKGCTVQLPPDIVKAALSYTSRNSIGLPFDLTTKIPNFLWEKRNSMFKPVPQTPRRCAVTASPWTTASSSSAESSQQQSLNTTELEETAILLNSTIGVLDRLDAHLDA